VIEMDSKLLHQSGGQRTFSVVLATGDEVVKSIKEFADDNKLGAAEFVAIGAFEDAVLGYFDWAARDYVRNGVHEQVEVASLTGDVALAPDGSRSVHIHCVLGRRDGAALAGHLLEARVRPTLEIVLAESPRHLRKRYDPESRLALIEPSA
jgi:uncharacterized protein